MSLIFTLEIIISSHLLLFGICTLFNKKSRNLGVNLIGLFLTILGLQFLLLFFFNDHIKIQFAGTWSLVDYRPYLLNAFLLSYGPIIWIANVLYIKDSKVFKKQHLLHFIAIPIYTLLSILLKDSLTTWPTQKLSIDRLFIFLHILSYVIIAVTYSLRENNASDIKLKRNLLLLIDVTFGILILTWVSFILYSIHGETQSTVLIYVFLIMIGIMVDGSVIYFFKYPDLYIQSKYLRNRSKEWSSEKYNYSGLSDSYIETIIGQVNDLLLKKLMYKNPTLTLANVSEDTGFPTRDISQVINSKLNKSFREYLNEIRIKRAGELFDENRNLRVSEVMYEVGYNSKSSFHKYFKKKYGKTPKQYLKYTSKYIQ